MQKYQDKASTCLGWEMVSLRPEDQVYAYTEDVVNAEWGFQKCSGLSKSLGTSGSRCVWNFFLSLRILRHLKAFKKQAWEESWDAVRGSAGSDPVLGWEEPGQECSDTDSARDCPLGSCVPDFVSVPERIGWEQEDQQGGQALHELKQEVCSPLKWAPQGWWELCPSMQLQIPAFLHSPFPCDLASCTKEVFLPTFCVVWDFIFHSASVCRAFGLPDAASN